MSNFLIFKAAFNNSATPAIGTYTAEGATALFTKNTNLSPDYYLYTNTSNATIQWFVPTKETTDFEFVADILTRAQDGPVTYFVIADSTGTARLRMWLQSSIWYFENSDSIATSGPEYIGTIDPAASGGLNVFHQFRVRVRKLTASSSSVEVYVDGTLKLTATAGAALVTCAKIGFLGGISGSPSTSAGIQNVYVYDLSGGEVIDRGVLSGAFNRFINWAKNDSGFITSAIKEGSIGGGSGWCLLYGDLLIQWGTVVFNGQGTFTFSKPYASTPSVVMNYGDTTGYGVPCGVAAASTATTYFTARSFDAATPWRCNWIAIGKKGYR